MKKGLFVLGVAVAALASCTQNEVVDIPQNRAIGFSAFVNNQTKAVIPVTSINSSQFYVFGEYATTTDSWTTEGSAFNNETGDATYYWKPDKTYRFGAYADGLSGQLSNASFDAANRTLKFTGYTPKDLDLVAAVSADIDSQDATQATNANDVSLTFKHMLSQVKLTFTTDASSTYQLTISGVSISNAVSTADGTLVGDAGTPTWNNTSATAGYAYEEFNEGGQLVSKNAPVDQVKLVIPQNETNNITVTFTATVKAEGTGTTTFTANLGHGLTDANTWKPGYCYNYTAEVKLKDVLDNLGENNVPILFNPSVDGWETEQNVPVTPTPGA